MNNQTYGKLEKWIFIVLTIFLYSCNFETLENSTYKEETTITSKREIKLFNQEFTILFHKGYSPFYKWKSAHVKKMADSTIMAIYNEKDGMLDIFNIDKQKLTKQIFLPFIFGNIAKSNISISSIYIESLDSIFLLTDRGLFIVNYNGKVIYTNYLNSLQKVAKNEIIYRNTGNFPIYFDSKSNNVYLNGFCNRYTTYSNKFYDEPIEYSLSIVSDVQDQLPMKFSELYKKGYYSTSIYPKRLITDSFHIYSFGQDPNIYLYNKIKKDIIVKGGKSKFQTEMIPYFSKTVKFSKDKEMTYLKTISSYGQILHDPFRNFYYRFFKQSQPTKNIEGLYNTEFDKYESLIILDKDFEVLKEINLDRNKYFSAFSFITKEGLLIAAKDYNSPNSNSLKFHLISIN